MAQRYGPFLTSVFNNVSNTFENISKKLRETKKGRLAFLVVIRLGLEPKTPTLKVLCSTC